MWITGPARCLSAITRRRKTWPVSETSCFTFIYNSERSLDPERVDKFDGQSVLGSAERELRSRNWYPGEYLSSYFKVNWYQEFVSWDGPLELLGARFYGICEQLLWWSGPTGLSNSTALRGHIMPNVQQALYPLEYMDPKISGQKAIGFMQHTDIELKL
jgi:hypothetical protein